MPRHDAPLPTTAFEFALLVAGLDVEGDATIDAFYSAGLHDGVIEGRDGAAVVTLIRTAADPGSALASAIADVERAVPGARVVRVDDQLVGLGDLADLAARTPESLRLLATDARGPGGFPTPAGIVGKGVRVWRWADVRPWLVAYGIVDATALPATLPPGLIATTNARISADLAGTA